MGVLDWARKSLGFNTPAAIDTAMAVQQMDQSADLGPGRPLMPVRGYSQRPRVMDYPVGVNLSTQSRQAYGRTSFNFLREFSTSYDVARICINHKIDEIRSMGLLFQAADGETGDVRDALDASRTVLAFPDREHPFEEWLSLWLENLLRFDAGPLYRRRDRDGNIIGLEVLDGSTIAPYLDEHGRRPAAPAPAYYQLIKGQVWSWYTAEDLVYTRFRPQTDSPYGLAPVESILLTVNTDMKFQWHLLQMFTDGSVPHGFIELPPDISNPDQVAEWQDYWDAIVLGDQAKLHQLVAVPAGTKVTETRPKAFDEAFSDHLAIRTASAFGVVPQDIGLIKDVNRANGDTQVDVQFRVNTLPWVRFVQQTLNRYLQHDLGLPVKIALDTGRDKEDRLTEAQAWQVYVQTGFASMDEARQELLGLPIDNERPIPRGIITPRTGFVPLTSILGISGPIDGETGAPDDTVPLPTTPFSGAGGLLPDKGPGGTEFTRAPINPDEPAFPALEHVIPGTDVVNGMPTVGGVISKTAGVTSGTGIVGDPLEDAKAELAKFRAFTKTRLKQRKWRDFQFTAVDEITAHRLNVAGLAEIRKADGELIAAGLAVRAADTGRVLMLQRALDPEDPAGGTLEFPGGHIESGESPLTAAVREWCEEVGVVLPHFGEQSGDWISSNGIYQGFVYRIDAESQVPVRGEGIVTNPDDPDGDMVEAILWVDPQDLAGNPMLRPELGADLAMVLTALGSDAVPLVLAKAWRDSADKVPQHKFDLKLTDHYLPVVQAALVGLVGPVTRIVDGLSTDLAKAIDEVLFQRVRKMLADQASRASLEAAIRQIMVDGYTTGAHAAGTQLGAHAVTIPGTTGAAVADVDWSSWVPGDTGAAMQVADGGLRSLLDSAGITVQGITDTILDEVGNGIADGLTNGWSSEKIGRSIADLVGSDSRAMMIAHTEVARAQTAGSMDTYTASGVGTWDWVLSDDPCEECQAEADANPHQMSDTVSVPLHPWCRCAQSPNADSISLDGIQTEGE